MPSHWNLSQKVTASGVSTLGSTTSPMYTTATKAMRAQKERATELRRLWVKI